MTVSYETFANWIRQGVLEIHSSKALGNGEFEYDVTLKGVRQTIRVEAKGK